jgi:thioredoxin-dependent peroxiredoxin
MRKFPSALLVCASILVGARSTEGQQPTTVPGPQIGDIAPDFALPGATRFGLLKDPFRLSDYRGRTIVLAFFFRARTKG